MGHYGALPEKFAKVSPRFFTPGYATIVSAIVASVFYAVMRFLSEDVLWDTITALGMMICFYYGITAFACVWFFRKHWFDSVRNVFFTLLFPLVGGVILGVLFFTTLIDSMNPDYGSGSNIFGVGLVFVLGMVVLLSGVAIMLVAGVEAAGVLPRRDALAGGRRGLRSRARGQLLPSRRRMFQSEGERMPRGGRGARVRRERGVGRRAGDVGIGPHRDVRLRPPVGAAAHEADALCSRRATPARSRASLLAS